MRGSVCVSPECSQQPCDSAHVVQQRIHFVNSCRVTGAAARSRAEAAESSIRPREKPLIERGRKSEFSVGASRGPYWHRSACPAPEPGFALQ